MNSYLKDELEPTCSVFVCGRCSMFYSNYKHLLEHLYWRHGTESEWCKQCRLKKWHYAAHCCNVLPIYEQMDSNEGRSEESISDDSQCFSERESEFCHCGKLVETAPMIGCDGPSCKWQWFHFQCVGIVEAPDGDWICPDCNKNNI